MSDEDESPPLEFKTPLFKALNVGKPVPDEEEIYAACLSRLDASQPFTYDKWRDLLVRTFKIFPGERDEPLEGFIYSHSLAESLFGPSLTKARLFALDMRDVDLFSGYSGAGLYHALSYTWGGDQELFPLRLWPIVQRKDRSTIVDAERAGVIYIRKNLRDFMVEMRGRNHLDLFWIDAICIDQQIAEDKEQHLARMKYIYNQAEQIFIWFDFDDVEGVDDAIARLPALTRQLLTLDPDQTWTPSDIEQLADRGLPDAQDIIWKALRKILTHPWWSRTWTLQEVNAAESPYRKLRETEASIVCANSLLRFATVEVFAWAASHAGLEDWIISGSTEELVEDYHAFDSIREIGATRDCGKGGTVALRVLLQSTRRRSATLPQDMIFGQAGMHYVNTTRWLKDLGLAVSSSPRDVFVTFAKHYLSQELGECLLNHVNTKERLADLPSWCPNFASKPETFCLGSRWRGFFERGFNGTPWKDMPDKRAYRAGFQPSGQWQMPRKKMFWAGRAWVNAFKGVPSEVDYFDVSKGGIQLVPGSDLIKCEGVELDTVTDVIDCSSGFDNLNFFNPAGQAPTLQWLRKCLKLTESALQRRPSSASTSLTRDQAICRTLVGNRVRVGIRLAPLAGRVLGSEYDLGDGTTVEVPTGTREEAVFDVDEQPDMVTAFSDYINYCTDYLRAENNPSCQHPSLTPAVASYARLMQRISKRRCFFATKNGRVGIGPSDTKVDDVLSVISFCPTPYLLRKASKSTYSLVGETYVHGLMYGEALDMLDQGKVSKSIWFVE